MALLRCAIEGYGDIGSSRRAVMRALNDCRVPVAQAEAVGLIASELMTNAIAHADPPYVLDVTTSREDLAGRTVTVTMTDHGAGTPVRRDPRSSPGPGGHGLNLIAATSSEWGVRAADQGGKEVWAVVTAESAASPNGR